MNNNFQCRKILNWALKSIEKEKKNELFEMNVSIRTSDRSLSKRRSSFKQRDDQDDDDGATWSISSYGGISRSSHDDPFYFQSYFISIEIKRKMFFFFIQN